MTILAIESSCDETAAAVTRDDELLANVIASQQEHLKYGGVVPELASRAHIAKIVPVVQQAVDDSGLGLDAIDAVAATYGPGLVGSLLVGLTFAKGLALARNLPFLGVNHIEGHLFSATLEHPELRTPFLCLVISGGHTILAVVRGIGDYEILGQTIDDAAGEAFDKVAKVLGLPYPGGPAVEKLAAQGDPSAIRFPIARLKSGDFDFSFSGLKTAVLYHYRGLSPEQQEQQRNRWKGRGLRGRREISGYHHVQYLTGFQGYTETVEPRAPGSYTGLGQHGVAGIHVPVGVEVHVSRDPYDAGFAPPA